VAVPGDTSLVEKVTTVATGNLVIQGLDSGTYYLTEVKAPDTYVKLTAPIQIKIESDGTVKLVTTTTGTGDNAQTSTVETAVSEISVANNKITATLPTTGGMGTTAIYIAGGLMMMAAAILLIVKKQTNK
jgi:LPXTG-motif cell wall-anchored protein